MNLRDMDCFIMVCRKQSISAAAEALFMSPQGVSKAIRRMEEESGAPLLDRATSGVSPTAYGKIFLAAAIKITHEYDDTLKKIADLKAQTNGYLRLVSAFGILRYLSPEFVQGFSRLCPSIHLDYMEYPDIYVEENLLNKQYDVGMVPYLRQNPGLVYEPLFSKEIYFITHEGSAFFERNEVSVKEISAEPFVIENSNFLIHHIMESICERERAKLDIYFNTSGFSLCYKLCKDGEANTASMDFIFQDMSSGALRKIPFREHPMWNVALVRRRDMPLTETMNKFRDYALGWRTGGI